LRIENRESNLDCIIGRTVESSTNSTHHCRVAMGSSPSKSAAVTDAATADATNRLPEFVDPTDRITVNAGGRLYETTVTTLVSSGSRFFGTVLGEGGVPGAGREAKEALKNEEVGQRILYVECDPVLFSDVLYFMRRKRLRHETSLKLSHLEDLQLEARFFEYDELDEACSKMHRVRCLEFPCFVFVTLHE